MSIPIPETKIKFNDKYSLKNLYILMHEYLVEEKWYGKEGPTASHKGNQHRDIETLYLEKFHQKGIHKGGKELWVYWRLFKRPEGRHSGYIRYKLNIDFHGAYLQNMEAIVQGKKVPIQKGELELIFNASVETDYTGEWKNHWFLKHYKDLYEKRIISQELEKHEKMLWREVYRFTSYIKRYLDLRVFLPTPKTFQPTLYGAEG
ncbi:MAG: hypothetical protein U9O94_04315 [Nanoarchaeota archaeon]|nr:hypothetical protein [Nanoarchaeota archaeon]